MEHSMKRAKTVSDVRMMLRNVKKQSYRNIREKSEDIRKKDARIKHVKKSIDEFNALITGGWRDMRGTHKICKECNKRCICVSMEFEYCLKEDETFCGYKKCPNGKRINWPDKCVKCTRNYALKRSIMGCSFDATLCDLLIYHIGHVSIETRKNVLQRIRLRCRGYCATCGITLINHAKTGYKQESINHMHPNKRIDVEADSIDDLVQSCLACNLFQNKMSWDETYRALCQIILHKNEVFPIPETALNFTTKGWCYFSSSRGTTILKRDVLERDGWLCSLSGMPLRFDEPGHWNTVSLDRIDSKKGYSIENCQLVCKNLNFVKRYNITHDECQSWLTHIRSLNVDDLRKIMFPSQTNPQ
jgi:hypothetical protein